MQGPKSKPNDQEAMMPLLCAIQAEVAERSQRIQLLEERLEAFASTPRIHADEVTRLRSELSTQRREMRHVARELAGLGVEFDPEEPRPIVVELSQPPGLRADLEQTGFRLWSAASFD